LFVAVIPPLTFPDHLVLPFDPEIFAFPVAPTPPLFKPPTFTFPEYFEFFVWPENDFEYDGMLKPPGLEVDFPTVLGRLLVVLGL